MKSKAFAAALLAAALLFALTACGKTQTPAAPNESGSAARQTEQQNDAETSANEASPTQGDEASGDESVLTGGVEAPEEESVPAGSEEAPEEEPWKTALAEDLFEKYGVLPEYYEDLGDGIYQVYVEVGGEVVPFVTVDSATGDYHG